MEGTGWGARGSWSVIQAIEVQAKTLLSELGEDRVVEWIGEIVVQRTGVSLCFPRN